MMFDDLERGSDLSVIQQINAYVSIVDRINYCVFIIRVFERKKGLSLNHFKTVIYGYINDAELMNNLSIRDEYIASRNYFDTSDDYFVRFKETTHIESKVIEINRIIQEELADIYATVSVGKGVTLGDD
jgi:hypothetical protein